jgi:TrmH family RNA methyltransferase
VRERRGRFLVEGPQAVREALLAGRALEVLATAGAAQRHPDLPAAAAAAGIEWQVLDPAALASVTETVADQGVVAIARIELGDADEVFGAAPRLIAGLCDVRDPGNAGTVIRCADAAGADAVALAGDAVDPHNGKCVRASAGSLFHLPVLAGLGVDDLTARARLAGLRVLAADGCGAVDLDDAADSGLLTAPTLWLFGTEAHGLSDAQRALADAVVAIPIHGRAESLNLATAAAICLYASARAHRC